MEPEQKSIILITCSAGLVDYVRREVEDVGYQVGESHKTGLEVEGDLYDTMRLNLYLRTAHNVLFLLKQFKCNYPDELYHNTMNLPWEEIISPQEYLSVVGKVNTEHVDNSMYANLKVKDAIVDRIANKTSSRPDSGKDKNKVVVQFYWKDDHCWLYLNTSGKKLSDCAPADDLSFLMPISNAVCLNTSFTRERKRKRHNTRTFGAIVYLS